MKIGDKVVLWKTEYKQGAYRDQMGISHEGSVVVAEVIATVVKVRRNVPGMFNPKTKHRGFKAVSEDGRQFFCNWTGFPDDSLSPTYFWMSGRHPHAQVWYDACQAYGSGRAFVTPAGERAVPCGVQICAKHNVAYMATDDCERCAHP